MDPFNYADYPSPENASKVIELLPVDHVSYTGSKQEKDAFDFIYNWAQFKLLKK